jgi:outer membrane protein assembly factor BamB
MNHGSASHDGRMTGLPAETKYTGVWQEKWITRFSDGGYGLNAPQGAATTPVAQPRIMIAGARRPFPGPGPGAAAVPTGFDARRRATVKKWESSDWLPTDTLLMHGGRVYIRAYDRVVCVDGRTGKSVFASPRRVMPQVRPQPPSTAEEVLLFGDRASNTMSIADGVLYYIEEDNTGYMQNSNSFHRNRAGLTAFRPQMATRIVALDARTGKLQWQTEPESDDKGTRRPVRYQSAPVPYGNLLIVPVIDNGAIWLYAHRADKKGELAWKTFLADDPPGGYNPWASTGLAVAGGDAYLVSGGVVFNVDATGGLVRWAARYNRDLDGSARRNPNYGNQQSPTARGWDDDVIIPYGRTLIVAASDRDAVMALDRRTGRTIWDIPRDGATHILGVSGRNLFVAGRSTIRRYDLLGGALARETELEKAITGRGFVAEDALYLPMGNAVMRFHPTTLKRLSAVGVALPITDSEGKFDYNDPLGNLFSDGQRLFGVGMERAYALGAIERAKPDVAGDPLKPGVEPLPVTSLRKESTGDANIDILLDHGVEPTAASLARYLNDLHPSDETKKQIEATIRQLGDDDYAKRRDAQAALLSMPVVPVEAIVAAMEHSPDAEVRDSAARIFAATDGKRARVLFAALSTISKKEIKGLTAPTLAAIPLCTQPYLLESAGRALRATATDADADSLRKAAGEKTAELRIVAAGAMGSALKDKGLADLRTLAKDADERVRIAAARALADLGDRGSMDLFAALLDSDNVYTRGAAARALRAFTGQQIDFVPYDDAEKRKAGVAKWKAWIAADGKTAKLTFPLADTRFQLGRTLIANYRTGQVYEVDASGSQTWSINVQNPWGVLGLSNGHRLVSSYTQRNVVEYDDKGEKVWEQTNLPSAPFSIERLENGNTLIACSNSNRVVEVDAQNKIVWDVTVMGRPTEARRLPNGRTLVALQNGNRIVEVNSEGKEEWKVEGVGAPLSAQRLPNGNTLVAEVSGNRVREFDANGKEVWNLTQMAGRNVQTPYYAERLENGNTMVADATGVREVSAKGDVIWEKLDQGVSRVSRY